MKILTKLVLACAVFALISLTTQIEAPAGKADKRTAFPNSAEAPTNKTLVAKKRPAGPLISNSFSETDPKARIRKSEFFELFRYATYKLTRGEAEQIFIFADRNKDDLLDHGEWEDFVALYVLPFEACDASKNYIVGEKEFTTCFKADPRTNVIEFRRRYVANKSGQKHIMDILQTRGATKLNFSDYVFYRRALYGWSECHSTAKYLSRSGFRCAMLSCIPQKYNHKLDYDMFYDTGLKLTNDRNLIEMDFIAYLRTAHFMNYFVTFAQPLNTPFLERTQFLRAVSEDRLPTNFEVSEINQIYDLTYNTKSMDFPTFAFFFHLHSLFNKYSIEKPLALSQPELLKLFKDEDGFKDVLFAIDNSYTEFSETEYLEGSLILQKKRLSEKGFYSFKQDASMQTYSFKQDASVQTNATNVKTTINKNALDIKANDKNRKVFFNIMVGLGKKYWAKVDFYRAFQISNLYISIRDLPVSHNVGVLLDNLQNMYDTVTPTFNDDQRKNYKFYKMLPKDVGLDMLTFMALENFVTKIQIHKFNAETVIEETLAKAILKDNGMNNMPDTVFDLAKKGYDSLKRREYIAMDLVNYVMIVHSATNEIRRTKEQFKAYGLKQNFDNTRRYPAGPRRFMSSPNV